MIDTTLFGKLAGSLSIAAYLPFIWAILQRKATPNRATWMIWTIISGSIFFSYESAGATNTIWLPAGYTCGSFIISLLSIKYGEGGWSKLDRKCIGFATIGLFLWWLLDSPLYTLYISASVDIAASIPTVKKAYTNPLSEDKATWALFWIGSLLNVIAIDKWEFVIYMYPLAIFFIISIIAPLVIWDKQRPWSNKTTQEN